MFLPVLSAAPVFSAGAEFSASGDTELDSVSPGSCPSGVGSDWNTKGMCGCYLCIR